MRRAAVLLLLLSTSCGRGRGWDAEVAALNALRPEATTEEFLASPALHELLAAFDEAAPAIARGQKSPSWAVRARCLYVACVNQLVDVEGVSTGGDPHPEVNAVYAQYAGACGGGGSLLGQPEIKKVIERRPLMFHESVEEVLPPELRARRLNRIFQVLEEPRPLAVPVTSFPELFKFEYKPLSRAAMGCLMTELQGARDGHALVERVLAALEAAAPDRPERLALLIEVCRSLDNHEDPSHPEEGPCPAWPAYEARLSRALLARVDGLPVYPLSQAMFLLEWITGGRPVLEKLASSHPHPEIRSSAAWHLRDKK